MGKLRETLVTVEGEDVTVLGTDAQPEEIAKLLKKSGWSTFREIRSPQAAPPPPGNVKRARAAR